MEEYNDQNMYRPFNQFSELSIYVLVSVILIFIIIGIPIMILIGIFALIMTINTYDGKVYRYPLVIWFKK